MGFLKTWIPWRGTSGLLDTLQAVLDTYLYFIPRTLDSNEIKGALQDLAKHAQVINFEMPRTSLDCQRAFEYLLPGFALLRNPDVEVRAAYVSLLLKDFPKARSIKQLDKIKTKQFLQFDDWESGILSLVKERHGLPMDRNPELHYVSYDYWKSALNVTEMEITEIEEQVEVFFQQTKLPKETLYAELYVSVTRDDDQKYKIAFFNNI